eukprot:SAG11_NODE_1464_length_4862_cov_1.419064_7_plen_63_part_00
MSQAGFRGVTKFHAVGVCTSRLELIGGAHHVGGEVERGETGALTTKKPVVECGTARGTARGR